MLCPCALLAVPNARLWQCRAGGICSQCIQSMLKQQLTGQADRQHTVKAFSREKGRGHVVWRGARFLISSTHTKKCPGKRKAIAIFAPCFVFTWTLLHVTYCCIVLHTFALFFAACVHDSYGCLTPRPLLQLVPSCYSVHQDGRLIHTFSKITREYSVTDIPEQAHLSMACTSVHEVVSA